MKKQSLKDFQQNVNFIAKKDLKKIKGGIGDDDINPTFVGDDDIHPTYTTP